MRQTNPAQVSRFARICAFVTSWTIAWGVSAPLRAQETPQITVPTIPTVDTQQLLPAAVTAPTDVNITPDLPAILPLQAPTVPIPETPVVEPGEVQLDSPSFTPPPFSAPQFNAPQFVNPTLTAPTLAAPTFNAPTLTGLQTSSPQFTAPSFTAPTFNTPTLNAPTLTAPTLNFVQAPPEASVQPVTVPAAEVPVTTVELGN